jgi:hypothetical protein
MISIEDVGAALAQHLDRDGMRNVSESDVSISDEQDDALLCMVCIRGRWFCEHCERPPGAHDPDELCDRLMRAMREAHQRRRLHIVH